jgi:hypothetical protein
VGITRDRGKIVVAAVVAALLAGGGALAGAAARGVDDPAPGTVTPRAGASSPTESVFVPITPCRIVNSQNSAGRFSVGEIRGYVYRGSTAVQGGAADCGIPAGVEALEVSMTAVLPQGDGYLRIWPGGVGEPNATFLNYQGGENTTSAGAVAMGTVIPSFRVKAYRAPTHVIVDVLGYYTSDAFAVIAGDGSVARGNGVTLSTRGSEGIYIVRFDRDITGCAHVAAIGTISSGSPARLTVGTATLSGRTDSVYVEIKNPSGAFTDNPFHLVIDC